MCGICGQIKLAGGEPVDMDTIRRMAATIVHRGPDDEGYFLAGPLGFGFRRLSIIDLAGGHQPMSDTQKTVWTVFNGEIYNYRELRSELAGHGHIFQTSSDTEVIIHGYKQWGTKVFDRLNGMFGVAIWDVKRKRLIVARDPMGIKLIYYRLANGTLSFGSEIRPVLAADNARPEVDPVALHLFLRFRYTPSPLTIFQGVRKLAPGAMLIVENGECREERWYDFRPEPFSNPPDDREATEELFELYRAAVKRHLLADVPVGILLSGGLDSGLLLALMNEHGRNWPAYTIGYGKTFADDELADAAETASLLGARHSQVQLDQAEFEKALPDIVRFLEEPVAASSIVPMYFVCRRARQDVKVALIGQGPDELFGGYKRHLGVQYGSYWRGMPNGVKALAASVVSRLPRNETLKRGVQSLGVSDRLTRYQDIFSLVPATTVDGLFRDANGHFRGLVEFLEPLKAQMENLDELGGFQLMEIRSSLPDELLMYADKLSMAHSLEARVPYLDRTVVEYAQRLDASYKIRGGERKWLHRRVCEKFLPRAILNRKKRGFAVNVVDDWFNASAKGRMKELLLDEKSAMYSLLDPKPVKRLLAEHQSRRQDNHKLLFSLVMFEQWLRTNFDGKINNQTANRQAA
ncbi:MAG TPA: asparagine synthase (glutamine-hydrolyzing) [Candidatus Acidoferrales bacterium]|jgi:asparagine synthase (glutamine-hydrolysing)|nr:asparagine synthase (glutamine-hydrolyzing) [Candidatus Acidoferrales bacterium]